MTCQVIKIIILITIYVSGSKQDKPTAECQRDTRLFFSADRYFNGLRSKCTFNNVNSFEDFKAASSNISLGAQNIISIAFNDSNLSEFPDRMFASYQNLRSLDGSNLRLEYLSQNILGNIFSMDNIDLSFNLLKVLGSKIFANKKLKYLNLANNMINSIDDSAFSGSEIEKLNLEQNKIKNLAFVNGLKFFNLLQLNDNEIDKFDNVKISRSDWIAPRDSIFGVVYPSINLANNKLNTFDCKSTLKFTLIELKSNSELKSLDLGECAITLLDVSDCLNIKNVKFSDNLQGFTAKNVKFDDIDFTHAQSLETLKLSNNSLKPEILSEIMKLENLTTLDISYNEIGPLNISTFSKLKKLTSLGLKSTKVSNIQFGTFSHQNGVRMFDISDNNLGSFDMQMIYSMTSLTTLDLSGNELTELTNLDAAHNTFALLEKIDLTNNKWTCNYLLRLVKIMRAYRVVLTHSYIEEHQSNINGIYCRHVPGEDNVVEPLSPNASNITDIREKMNEIVNQLSKETDRRNNIDVRLLAIERQINSKTIGATSSEALRSDKVVEIVQIQNSTLFEMTFVIVLGSFIIFITLKIVVYVRRNFMSQIRPMRVGLSENTLAMNVDDY